MPVATYALTGDFSGLVGEVSSIRATVNTNSIDGGWVNDVDNTIVLGGTVLAVGADGKFTVTLPTSTGTDLQYQVTAEYTDGSRNRKVWESGWFSLTAAGDLADLANDSTLRVTQTLGDQLAARIDGYQDHGNVSGVLTVDPAIGTHVLVATGSLLVTLDTAPDGRIVTLYVVSGASNVTVDGITGLTLTDGSFASFVHIRGAWVLASAGGTSTPATPDTTPPSNVTGLTATGGSGQITASWTAATDTESTVSYRWRVWLTSGGAGTTAWTTTTATNFTKTGLTGGGYTVEVYAYSSGGASATATATATVTTPEIHTVLDNFDGTNGTALTAHAADTGGTWTKAAGAGALTLNGSGKAIASGSDTTFTEYTHTGTTFTDGTAAVDFTMATGAEFGVALRHNGSTTRIFFGVAGANVGIYPFDGGTLGAYVFGSPTLTDGTAYRLVLAVTGTTATAKIQRLSDGKWADSSSAWVTGETTFKTTTVTSSSGSPGLMFAQPGSNGSGYDRFTADAA